MNIVVLMGRLTADPELKTSNSGISYCRFSAAVDRAYTKGEEKKTDFINCVAWRQTAEFISHYFTKGQMIAIQGSMQTDSYINKDGAKINTVFVNVNKADFCGSKSESSQQHKTQPAAQVQTPARYGNGTVEDFEITPADDDLPF